MTLFREQAVARQRQRLYGEVRLDTPVSGWILTALIGALVAGLVLALALGTYARKETVTGWLVPDLGLARVAAPQQAMVERVHVVLGQTVKEGDPLMTLRADADLAGGATTTEALLRQLDAERREVAEQLELVRQRAAADRSATEARLKRLDEERRQVERQHEQQKERIRLAEDNLARYDGLLEYEAASPLEVNRVREAVLLTRQEAASLAQRIVTLKRESGAARASLDRSPLDENAQAAELRARLATLDQRRTEYERRGGFVLRAPVAGKVASLASRPGESVPGGLPLASVLPEGGVLEAELFVPTRAAGFVEEGQDVRLQLDAFPHQKFGMLTGEVARVSATVTTAGELPVPILEPSPVYRSTVALHGQSIGAYGKEFPLQAGMSVRADIVQERRSIWRVLLDPLLSR